MIAIEKGVEVPRVGAVYPYEVMEIGDSFLVPNGVSQVVCNSNFRMGRKLKRKFMCRRVEGGIRVWRIG